MKTPKLFLTLICGLSSGRSFAGHEIDNGGDAVEVTFFKAKATAARMTALLDEDNILRLPIDRVFINWLRESQAGTARYNKLAFYLSRITLEFQEDGCREGASVRPICFDDSKPDKPTVHVSRILNRQVDSKTALALIFHEAGHFTGEQDHLFLSEFGVQMSQDSVKHRLVKVEKVPTSFEGFEFTAKDPYENDSVGSIVARHRNANYICRFFGFREFASYDYKRISSGTYRSWNFTNDGRLNKAIHWTDLTPYGGGLFSRSRVLDVFTDIQCKNFVD